jgi:hypothetical protein
MLFVQRGNAALRREVPIARRLGEREALGLDHSGAAVEFLKAIMLDFVQPVAAGIFLIEQDFRRATMLHNARVSNPVIGCGTSPS